jgi:hypothetical protein
MLIFYSTIVLFYAQNGIDDNRGWALEAARTGHAHQDYHLRNSDFADRPCKNPRTARIRPAAWSPPMASTFIFIDGKPPPRSPNRWRESRWCTG